MSYGEDMMVIDTCVGCGHCVPYCPAKALSVFGRASIDVEKCVSCKICVQYCPNSAIREDSL